VTEKADYDTKVKQAQKFLSKGAKVKLTMTFSGREMRFKDQGKEIMLVSYCYCYCYCYCSCHLFVTWYRSYLIH
jgi:hypothetical protein